MNPSETELRAHSGQAAHLHARRTAPDHHARRWASLPRAVLAVLILGLALASCEQSSTGPSTNPDISGSWTGTYLIGSATLSAAFSFNGISGGTGSASIQSLLSNTPFEWSYDQTGRAVLLFSAGCESWLGSLTPDDRGQILEGSLQVSREQCPAGDNESGLLSLSR
jgi:hypothetical protein